MMPVQKTYYGNTIESAIAQAKKECGDETLLVESGPAEGVRAGAYRVVVELPEKEQWERTRKPAVSLAGVEAELGRLSALVAQLAAGVCATGYASELRPAAAALVACDLPAGLVEELLDRVERKLRLHLRTEPAGPKVVRQALAEEIESRIHVDSLLGRPGAKRKIVALAGPAGAGKTTSLVKLAMRAGVAARRPAMILSTDAHRVAAAEQLRSYAAILGLPFAMAETPGGLTRLIEEHQQKELVFIDTPGFGPRDIECAREWAAMLGAHEDIEVQLVLPATTRSSDLLQAVRWWEVFRPAKLLFTRLDEAGCGGGCVAAAMVSGKPVSYLCSGQRIPEDLAPATKTEMAEMVLRETRAAVAAA